MKKAALVWMAAGVLMARDGDGIRPRPSAQDYGAHETAAGVTLGASVIPPEQVKHMFATDLNRGYVVVEVAVYPEGGQEVELSASDFALKVGTGDMVRPTSPRAIASVLQRGKDPGRASDVTLYPSATIGYESGPVYDPVTGQRRGGGMYGGGGVGVGVGGNQGPQPPPRASTDRDRITMQQELEDKALPEGKYTRQVAGYLYFPRPSGKQKNALYEVTYYGASGKVRLAVPPQSK